MNEIPNYYPNFLKDKRESRTFSQIKRAYGKFQELLGSHLQTRIFITGGAAPYLLMNQDSNRLHDDIDAFCFSENIPILRKLFKDTPYYRDSWDSLNYKKEGLDFGLSLIIDNVPIEIHSFFLIKGKDYMILFFNPYNKVFAWSLLRIGNLSDYITKYRGADGEVYYMTTLEYIKKSKDLLSRPKDIVDCKFIEKIGINRDIYDRVLEDFFIIDDSYGNVHSNIKNRET